MRHAWQWLACSVVAGAALSAQTTIPSQAAGSMRPVIVSNVELVNMVFTAEDSHKAFVTGLHADDLRVLEDGRPQTIRYFSEDTDAPLTLGLLIDTSDSQRSVLPDEKDASRLLLRDTIHESDRAFVVTFETGVVVQQDLTNSQELLDAAVDRARIGRRTALWDAIYLACHLEMAGQTGRKAIVVMTDGGATPSEYSFQDASGLAIDTDTVVFFVDIYGFGGGAGVGPGQLELLAKSSGGRRFEGNNGKLAAAFARIEDILRHQYTLGYKSDRPQHDGTFRRVQIQVPGRKGITVLTRIGYGMPGK